MANVKEGVCLSSIGEWGLISTIIQHKEGNVIGVGGDVSIPDDSPEYE